MRTRKRLFLVILFFCLLAVVAGGVALKVLNPGGIPFVSMKEQWSIGIYRGSSPFALNSPLNLINPILKAEDITDVDAYFVADPFLVKEGGVWYLFFEVYNNATRQGDLAVATSTNTWSWDYKQVILDEPFHLSYPYVFQWQDDYYMIPESFEDNAVRLYKAVNFPTTWAFEKTLIQGRDYVDNSLAYYNGKFWLFSSVTANDTLYLFYADDLLGPWYEHLQSPVISVDKQKARPGGRVLLYEDRLYRYAQDSSQSSGRLQIYAYEITELTPTTYAEKVVGSEPIVKASGSGWNGNGMHQVDPVLAANNFWIASVDGYGKYLVLDGSIK